MPFARLRQYFEYRRAFIGHDDAMRFRRLRNRLEPDRQPQTIRVRSFGGRGVVLRPGTMDATTLWDVIRHGYHRPPEPIACRTIVSLGANAGYTTADLACRYPEAGIVAVEMDADNARLCEQNTAFARDRVQVVNGAIWESDGTLDYSGRDVHDLRVTALDAAAVAPDRARQARAIRLPTLFAEHALRSVDFMKMDIEGAEAAVFAADVSWLDVVRAILVEIHPPATVKGCRCVLERHGYRVSQFRFDHEAVFGVRDGVVG